METLGGPEVLRLEDVADEPHAGPGQVRVRVRAAGLNPMDWVIISNEEIAARFGISLPTGFGFDFAGVVDEVGEGAEGFAVGDRVFGGALSRAVADHVVVTLSADQLLHTPDAVDDVTASTLPVAAATAAAALAAARVGDGDTVLIGGAAGGVGVFAVQLARLAGARVLATSSEGSFEFLRGLGAEPIRYGEGLVDRVRAAAPDGIDAATDLYGTETAYAALALDVPAERISTIAAQDPDLHVQATGGTDAEPGTLDHIASLVAEGRLVVPIAAQYPVEQIREAVELQAGRHVRGKVVVTL
ncbi:NADP-dependent oxidoreductase [Amycolatopsis ultiminotia]|uniref:NADP-dependent oxidoreductase n=1 Tax=Amycolatopsis ultiminotia TaxID=543629 RepID=A0ABP6W7I6_9PSEU